MPEDTGTDWWGLIRGLITQYLPAGLAVGAGAWMDKQNASNLIAPTKAVEMAYSPYNDMMSMLNAGMQGMVPQTGEAYDPEHPLQRARTNVQNSMWSGAQAPAAFNPYTANPDYGRTDPATLQNLKTLASPGSQVGKAPAVYNPYTKPGQMSANPQSGNTIQKLLEQMRLANQGGVGGRPVQQQTMPFMQQSLKNRFTPRPQGG